MGTSLQAVLERSLYIYSPSQWHYLEVISCKQALLLAKVPKRVSMTSFTDLQCHGKSLPSILRTSCLTSPWLSCQNIQLMWRKMFSSKKHAVYCISQSVTRVTWTFYPMASVVRVAENFPPTRFRSPKLNIRFHNRRTHYLLNKLQFWKVSNRTNIVSHYTIYLRRIQ